jgi:hypothetical protein
VGAVFGWALEPPVADDEPPAVPPAEARALDRVG